MALMIAVISTSRPDGQKGAGEELRKTSGREGKVRGVSALYEVESSAGQEEGKEVAPPKAQYTDQIFSMSAARHGQSFTNTPTSFT